MTVAPQAFEDSWWFEARQSWSAYERYGCDRPLVNRPGDSDSDFAKNPFGGAWDARRRDLRDFRTLGMARAC
jgi:hypothetical protein